MKKIALVTGGAGFIGGHLVERLVREGWQVRVLDNFSSGSWKNLANVEGALDVCEGDIRDADACLRACSGIDTVFHMAAIASVASSVANPAFSDEVNVVGTLRMLMAARDQGVRRFVFSSSASVYGNAEVAPTPEEHPLRPESPYASGKACGEFYCRNFWSLHGLETVVLRYFNVFGPRQSAVSGYAAVVPEFVRAAAEGARPVVYGDGQQTRDFVYVENVAAANIRAAQAENAAGETFNVGGGRGISLLELLSELSRYTDRPIVPEFRAGRDGEVRHSLGSIARAQAVLGYAPTISLTTGLQRTFLAASRPAAGYEPVATAA